MKILIVTGLFSLFGIWLDKLVPLATQQTSESVEEFSGQQTGVYTCTNGSVYFKSEAPLEVIQAESKKLKGVLNPEDQAFAWTVEIQSFEGFNNPLQREHFNENYMESRKFPKATFSGKVIEKIDFSKNGSYNVRAKGKLNIHGKEQERIIKCQLTIGDKRITVQSDFRVLLADHDIRIPKIVYQKIAEEVGVQVDAELTRD